MKFVLHVSSACTFTQIDIYSNNSFSESMLEMFPEYSYIVIIKCKLVIVSFIYVFKIFKFNKSI